MFDTVVATFLWPLVEKNKYVDEKLNSLTINMSNAGTPNILKKYFSK